MESYCRGSSHPGLTHRVGLAGDGRLLFWGVEQLLNSDGGRRPRADCKRVDFSRELTEQQQDCDERESRLVTLWHGGNMVVFCAICDVLQPLAAVWLTREQAVGECTDT